MAFDLFITFSGLCMLVRRPDELLVLLPRTPSGDHRHVAVFGSHRRYQPDAAGNSTFVEHEMGAGMLSLDDLDTGQSLKSDLTGFDVADITGCVSSNIKPDAVFAQIVLNQGAPCPRATCGQHDGAYWEFLGSARRRLATSLHWRIRDVREETGGREGMLVRITPQSGNGYDVTLRPSEGQLRMYVFHTPPDERPSSPPPPPRPIQANQEARHFKHYFDLFGVATPDRCLPKFAGETLKERKDEKFMQFNFVGRRYSCLLATIDDPGTA